MQGHRTRTIVLMSSQGLRVIGFSLCLAMVLLILFAPPVHSAGWLGISIQEHVPEEWSIKGIKVVGVDADGPASKAGLRAGDIIVSVDGRPVESPALLGKMAREAGAGNSIQMTILRNGEMLNLNLTLAEIPPYLTLHQQGLELAEKNNYDQAISAFSKGINLNPKYAEAYKNRGNAYMEKKQYDAAIADYTKYIQLDPKSAHVFHNRGRAYQLKELYDQAISDYSKAIEMDPNAAFRYVDRGSAYYLKKLDNQAIRDYSRAIEIDPKFVPAYEWRGDAYMTRKQKDLAEADFKTAAKLSLEKGKELADKGEDEKAIRAFNWGIKHDTEYSSSIYYHRGLVYDKKGDYAKAVSDYTEAIRRNPDYGEAYQRRGTIYAEKMGDREKAQRDWQKAADLGRGANAGTAVSRLVCPSPIFGKLLWKGDKPECLQGYVLLPGWRFRQEKTPWVCARCPQNCSFVEEPDKTFICVSTGPTRRESTPPGSSKSPPAGDALLGEQWRSSDQKQKDEARTPTFTPFTPAPRTESEVRRALENMGFKIVKQGTIGAYPGYWIQIADHAKAAQFGFKELKQARATERGSEMTTMIGCWTEQKVDEQIIWIDRRDVEIRDDSKLPPYVKFYTK